MKVITFYSYKGGVGRSLAAANFSVYLAKLGLKTVLIDFDLEAPGIDAKFPLLEMPNNQKGILDYILHFQQKNEDPGSIQDICLQVPIANQETSNSLWLIPSGHYLSDSYYKKLSQLDWNVIFSEKRDGVSFFQQFVARIKKELKADFVIIDSRTGITEIAGLCTQQLADEVVALSSLSSESIKVTKYIKDLIQKSQVAQALGKNINIKIVVSRVPKPENLQRFKDKCLKHFEVKEDKLYFLFSCPTLEQEEFLAILHPDRSGELANNYIRLFYSLDLEIADSIIRAKIEEVSGGLLLSSREESEKQILELVSLYQHPEAYRAALRFYQFTENSKQVRRFGLKLLELVQDEEAEIAVAKEFLKLKSWKLDQAEKESAIRVLEKAYSKGRLTSTGKISFAGFLEDLEKFEDGLEVALSLCKDEELEEEAQLEVRLIAARCALKLENRKIASELIEIIPPARLDNALALLAIENLKENHAKQAYDIGKIVLEKDYSGLLLKQVALLAKELDWDDTYISDLISSLKQSYKFSYMMKNRDPQAYFELQRVGWKNYITAITNDEQPEYDDIPF